MTAGQSNDSSSQPQHQQQQRQPCGTEEDAIVDTAAIEESALSKSAAARRVEDRAPSALNLEEIVPNGTAIAVARCSDPRQLSHHHRAGHDTVTSLQTQ